MVETMQEEGPASQAVRELMRKYIVQRPQAREHDAFLQDRARTGRASMNAARGSSNEEVEAKFAARRAG